MSIPLICEFFADLACQMQPFLAERNSEGYRAIAGFIDKREGLI